MGMFGAILVLLLLRRDFFPTKSWKRTLVVFVTLSILMIYQGFLDPELSFDEMAAHMSHYGHLGGFSLGAPSGSPRRRPMP